MGGSRKQTQQTNSRTTTTLPYAQQRNVDALMRGALDYYNSGGRTYYPGETVAGFNPYQLEGQGSLLDFARGSGQDYANAALASNAFLLDPNNVLNPQNIPGYAAAQDATARLYTDNLLERILPSVRGGGTNAGQYGGSASGIGQALSVGRSNQALADSLTGMDLNAYAQGLSAMQGAQGLAPGIFALGAQPGSIVTGIGDSTQRQEQREIDADVARHMFGENEELLILNALQALTGSAGQYGGEVRSTGTTTNTMSGGNGLGQALGLALMGASLFMPGAGAAGAGAGAGKGGATAGAGVPFGAGF